MATTTDDFESERSRAAVAIACLDWLRCTGPTVESVQSRVAPPALVEWPRDRSEITSPDPGPEPRHPLWDRWIDG